MLKALSLTELQTVRLRTRGIKPKEVARQLRMSHGAVRYRMKLIYLKIGIDDITLLTRWAIAVGLNDDSKPVSDSTPSLFHLAPRTSSGFPFYDS